MVVEQKLSKVQIEGLAVDAEIVGGLVEFKVETRHQLPDRGDG